MPKNLPFPTPICPKCGQISQSTLNSVRSIDCPMCGQIYDYQLTGDREEEDWVLSLVRH